MKKQMGNSGFNLKGRGVLGNLVSSESHPLEKVQNVAAQWIPVDNIKPGRNQPRQFFSIESIESLASSFKEQGFRGAINVQKLDEGRFEIVAGERRWRAAKHAGLEVVRCIVDSYTDQEALEFALVENLQREDLSKLEETEGILRLIEAKLDIPCEDVVSIIRTEGHPDKYDRSDVAPSNDLQNIEKLLAEFNIELQTFRTKNLRTLTLPDDLKEAHLEKGLSYSSALELNKVKDDKARQLLTDECINERLSFREIKRRVKEILDRKLGREKSKAHQKLIKHFEDTLKRAKSSPHALQNVQKRKRLENLLHEIETLLNEDK